MIMWTTWWVWVVAGFGLGVLEVLVPGFIFLGFAIAAVLTGVLVGLGLLGNSVPLLVLVFAVLSVLTWLGLRRTMGVRPGQMKIWDKDVNDN
jgi:membrane protein implicated in regulation of membrane protease activity